MEKVIKPILENQCAAFEQIKTLSSSIEKLINCVNMQTDAIKDAQARIRELEDSQGRSNLFRN